MLSIREIQSALAGERESKRLAKAVWPLLIGLIALQFGIGFLPHQHQFIPDERAYCELAENMVNKKAYALDEWSFYQRAEVPNTYYAPGWPAVLAAGYVVGRSETGFWLISSTCWSLSILAVWWLSKELHFSAVATAAILLWFSLNPFLIYYHLHLMTETLAVLLVPAMLACGISMIERSELKLGVLFGLFVGAAFLTRTALMLIPTAIWAIAFSKFPKLRTARLFGVFLLSFLAIVSPWLWRMHSVGGGFTTSELKVGHNLYFYNYTGVTNPYNLKPSESIPFPDGLEDMTPLGRDHLLMRLGVENVLKDPSRYLMICLRRIYYLISPTPNFVTASRLFSVAMALSTFIFLYVVWGILGLTLWRRPLLNWRQCILLLALGLWSVVHIAIHASVRQRLPSDLIGVAICISKGSEVLTIRKPHHRWARARAAG